MKKKYSLFLLILIGYFLSLVSAKSLSLSTSSATITAGSPFSIQILADGIANLDNISIAGIEQLDIIGTQKASSIQIINGQQTIQQKITLQVVANKEGNLTIGPASVTTQSGEIRSSTIELSIAPSIKTLQSQLKTVEQSKLVFPWKKVLMIAIAIIAILLYLWRTKKTVSSPTTQTSIIESIHTRPDPQPKISNWLEKIPSDDDPLFAENAEHVIRNYLQSIRNTNVYHLTYQELLQLNSHQQGELRVPMEPLRHALMLLQKARYAKLDLDKKSLREHMETLFS